MSAILEENIEGYFRNRIKIARVLQLAEAYEDVIDMLAVLTE